MFTFNAVTPKGRRILVIGIGDDDIDAMRSADRRVMSVTGGARVHETVVIYGSKEFITGRLEKLGMVIETIDAAPAPQTEGQN